MGLGPKLARKNEILERILKLYLTVSRLCKQKWTALKLSSVLVKVNAFLHCKIRFLKNKSITCNLRVLALAEEARKRGLMRTYYTHWKV